MNTKLQLNFELETPLLEAVTLVPNYKRRRHIGYKIGVQFTSHFGKTALYTDDDVSVSKRSKYEDLKDWYESPRRELPFGHASTCSLRACT